MSSPRKATNRVSCYCLYVSPRLALSELRDYWQTKIVVMFFICGPQYETVPPETSSSENKQETTIPQFTSDKRDEINFLSDPRAHCIKVSRSVFTSHSQAVRDPMMDSFLILLDSLRSFLEIVTSILEIVISRGCLWGISQNSICRICIDILDIFRHWLLGTVHHAKKRKRKARTSSNILAGKNNTPWYYQWGNLTN